MPPLGLSILDINTIIWWKTTNNVFFSTLCSTHTLLPHKHFMKYALLHLHEYHILTTCFRVNKYFYPETLRACQMEDNCYNSFQMNMWRQRRPAFLNQIEYVQVVKSCLQFENVWWKNWISYKQIQIYKVNPETTFRQCPRTAACQHVISPTQLSQGYSVFPWQPLLLDNLQQERLNWTLMLLSVYSSVVRNLSFITCFTTSRVAR